MRLPADDPRLLLYSSSSFHVWRLVYPTAAAHSTVYRLMRERGQRAAERTHQQDRLVPPQPETLFFIPPYLYPLIFCFVVTATHKWMKTKRNVEINLGLK